MLNLPKLIRDNRDFKILMKNSIMSPEVKIQLQHTNKHIIDISTDSDNLLQSENDMNPINHQKLKKKNTISYKNLKLSM